MSTLEPDRSKRSLTENKPNKGSRTVPLLVIIVVPFVLQIFAAVGLTGWLSFRNGQKSINTLATQLRSEVADRIEQHLNILADWSFRLSKSL